MKEDNLTHAISNNNHPLPKKKRDVILQEDIKNGNTFEYEKVLYEIFFKKLRTITPPEELKTRILEHAHLEHHT